MRRAGWRIAWLWATLGAGCHAAEPAPPAAQLAPAGEAWLTAAQVQEAGIALAVVQEAALRAPVLAQGRIAFDDQRVVHVYPPVSGRVMQILAPLGGQVQVGTPLAIISSPDLGQAVADASRAHADLLAAQRNLERQRTLYEGHAAAQKDFEAARNQAAQAQAEYGRARHKSELLGGNERAVTDTYVLRAPQAGQVIARQIGPGSEVQGQYDGSSNVQELFTIGSLDTVWAEAQVFEMDLPNIDVGDAISVQSVAYPGEMFVGRVDWVASAIDPNTRTARVRGQLPNIDHRLKPEMFVRMRILADEGRALMVPRRGVLRTEGRTAVFVRHPENAPGGRQRFVRRWVRAREDMAGDMVPVLDGIRPGEQVVVAGGIILLGT
jgi:cobalt-zinc-cadmium efflux system membrane fusion protein